jgi:hypothetical protein
MEDQKMKLLLDECNVTLRQEYDIAQNIGGPSELVPGRQLYDLNIHAVFTSGLDIRLNNTTQARIARALEKELIAGEVL